MSARWSPRRVFLAVLPDADREAVVAQSMDLARLLDVEIAGVLVEERELFLAAGLPCTAELGLVSRRPRPIVAETLAAEVARSHAGLARALEAMAQASGRRVSLTHARASAAEALGLVMGEDVLVFAGPPARLDEPGIADGLRAAMARSAGLLLPAPPRVRRGPVIAFAGAVRDAGRMLPALERLAPEDARIAMLLGEDGDTDPERIAAHAPSLAHRLDLRAGAGHVRSEDALRAAAQRAAAEHARLLVVDADPAMLARARLLRTLLRAAGCPVLLLGGGRG